ncbi:MAG: hormogonium polysaccharide biosynthesis glycosyltransferase HpsP, partial [Jaaginema sp. PMC 1079.18]|nr:hormogonium polysaccharide biosynthesis glycosyltransferase HpsP [Jaaginema sp. PMC 1079.18]
SGALAKQGIDVTILTTNSNGDVGQLPLDVPLEKPIQQDGYTVVYFPCSPFRRYKFSLDLLRWLGKNAANYDIAHIHALFSPVSTAAARVARSHSLPYILRPLGTLDPADLRKKRFLKQIYATLWEKENIAKAAAIHFTSPQEAQISHRFGAKTQDMIVPLGVSLPQPFPAIGAARKHWQIPPQKPLIVFLSRIEPKKGLNLLLPALEALLKQGIDFHFALAGANPQDPDYEKQIRDRIHQSPLQQRTTITGFIGGTDKVALLQDADLFVLPSYYENFGIAVAEAMAAGTAVVISDQVHIWPNIKAADAGWVTTCDLEALTITLKSALEDRQQWQNKGKNAQTYAQNYYSWDAIARQICQEYQKILTRKNRPSMAQ